MENEQNSQIIEDSNNSINEISLTKKILIGVISFIGLLTTVKLAIIYYNANFIPNAPASFCSINEFVDCDSVAKTADSQFFGIPLALWGMFLYLFISLMMISKKLSKFKIFRFLEVFKNPYVYISALGIISFTISMILLCVSLFAIKKICILCLLTYILDLLIGLLAINYSKNWFVNIFKTSFFDFIDALKIKKYLIAFIVVALCAVGVLTYTSVSYKLAPQVKRINSIKKFVKINEKHENPYKITGNILGDENGKVELVVISDFRCPICQVYNIIIHKVISELDNVKVVHHQYPLDQDCNKYLKSQMHPGACALAKYAIAAEKQGNYWGLASEFYTRQPLTDFDVWMIAMNVGLNVDKLKMDVMSDETDKILMDDIDYSAFKGVQGTPAISINGSKIRMGVIPDYELKQLLLNAGATKKSNAK